MKNKSNPYSNKPISGEERIVKKLEVTEIMISRIENGKIVEMRAEEDVLTRRQQLGYAVTPPQVPQEKK